MLAQCVSEAAKDYRHQHDGNIQHRQTGEWFSFRSKTHRVQPCPDLDLYPYIYLIYDPHPGFELVPDFDISYAPACVDVSDFTDQNPKATYWLVVVRSPTNWSFDDFVAADRHGMPSARLPHGCKQDGPSNPFMFATEPSKRRRYVRDLFGPYSPKMVQRKTNGNGGGDEWWTSDRHRNDNNKETETLFDEENSRLMQAATQTSPECVTGENPSTATVFSGSSKDGRALSPRSIARERVERRSRAFRRNLTSPPPSLPARSTPLPPPRKQAVSPGQAECIRAIFAALLWHEGIVHDAIACAAFLKFHPQLPKQGARVVTRASHDLPLQRPQRHSVEVSNAGQYLKIQQTTLESLTRSGMEANRARQCAMDTAPITEEESHHTAEATSSNTSLISDRSSCGVVNVLPPALRALVALWDALSDTDRLSESIDKLKRRSSVDKTKNEETKSLFSVRKKYEFKTSSSKTPYSAPVRDRESEIKIAVVVGKRALWATHKYPDVRRRASEAVSGGSQHFHGTLIEQLREHLYTSLVCELCGGANVPPPIATHMRQTHPGCRARSSRGYDRSGAYRRAEPPPGIAFACGQLAQAYQLWYIYCEKCRERSLKTASSCKYPKTKTISKSGYTRSDSQVDVDHYMTKENAIFLLDLAPLTSSESSGRAGGSPPTPPGSLWQPAPPFQCLAAPRSGIDAARYHSLGRVPVPAACAVINTRPVTSRNISEAPRVHRSISMEKPREKTWLKPSRKVKCLTLQNNIPESRLITDDTFWRWFIAVVSTECCTTAFRGGSSLLAQPSAALQRLVGCGETVGEKCAVSAFESPRVDVEALMRRSKLALRSVTQPMCVHDVMWWFCTALEKYARLASPATSADDNKDTNVTDLGRFNTPTASAAALCPGGRAGRGARSALHAFLHSVSALAPSLPAASAAALQAVRCWALHYSPHDRAFLHRSQVFSVISKILSHSEDGAYEEGMLGAFHESFHSYLNKRPADGTETFWESGDEDRNKAKWIQVAYSGSTPDDRPHIVCLHVDNTRDTASKTLLVTFLYSGGSSELYHMQDIDIDSKAAAWLCYTLPRVSTFPIRVRCELRGPEPAVRVRQLRVLAAPAPLPSSVGNTPASILHGLVETETLRVFRLVTSQVFGKLLEWERTGSESGGESSHSADEQVHDADDSDLREHVVGILFAGHKLTSLQRQQSARKQPGLAMIGKQLCYVLTQTNKIRIHRHHRHLLRLRDNYCFEMLSLLLALSGSAVGRAHLAQRTELIADLLALLHTGSYFFVKENDYRDTTSKMLAAINYGNDLSARVTLLDHLVAYLSKAITVQVKVKGCSETPPGPIAMGGSVAPVPPAYWFMRGHTSIKHAQNVAKLLTDMSEKLMTAVRRALLNFPNFFISDREKNEHAHNQKAGLEYLMKGKWADGRDEGESGPPELSFTGRKATAKDDKISHAWTAETRTSFASYLSQLASMPENERRPARCITIPAMWLALAALCVCDQSHMDLAVSAEAASSDVRSRDRIESNESRSYCANHDDGETLAIIDCRTCGPLCPECDRFLHLNRAARTHHRQGKIVLAFALVDRRTLKGLAEFRGVGNGINEDGNSVAQSGNAPPGPPGLAGTCRFCGTRGNSGLLAIGNVCADQQCQLLTYSSDFGAARLDPCELRTVVPYTYTLSERSAELHVTISCNQIRERVEHVGRAQRSRAHPIVSPEHFIEHGRESCTRVLTCGHLCGGVLGERTCLPCLYGCAAGAGAIGLGSAPLRQDADDMCMICFTDPLQAAPAIQEDMSHWTLEEILTPIRRLREEVQRKALMRLEYEGLAAQGGRNRNGASLDPAAYAMERYAYYACHKCGKAYFGGLARCEADTGGHWEPSELVCGACSDIAGARTCPKHGADFLEYKCRYCCSVAVFFCFGTSHFCNACHDDFQRITNIPKHMLPRCPSNLRPWASVEGTRPKPIDLKLKGRTRFVRKGNSYRDRKMNALCTCGTLLPAKNSHLAVECVDTLTSSERLTFCLPRKRR
ncbi:hypothetical protein EVAR_69406_1 [Eumeta japonica]|uniref:E3 ubiquitin-protein ligase MYCBP2 n=1 Tax=Eumeta variegata TaxID=151549 RepID=A0A4C2A1J7_EUMVA|nr:hypothetical protein EVAR_69406_1 [Eumeta japonica]